MSSVLQVAASQLGYSRWTDPKPGTKYGRWYAIETHSPYFGTNGVPYCAMFVSWVLAHAGVEVKGFPAASCGVINRQTKSMQLGNKRNAKAGDIVLFDWDGDGAPDHIGFVELNRGSYIQTIEGNTSSGNSGSQSNGGGVYRRTRAWNVVYAVIRINGDNGSHDGKKPAKIAVDGLWGYDTTDAMQYLYKMKRDKVVSSQSSGWQGKYTACTTGWHWVADKYADGSQLIEAIQTDLGITPDGIAGRETWRALERAAGYCPDEVGLQAPSNTVKWIQTQINKQL